MNSLGEIEYWRKKESVKDSVSLHYRKGDIIKFITSYKPFPNTWKTWYYTKEDKKKYGKLNHVVPRYADEKFALIVDRYRVVKIKSCVKYADYGVTVMMLSGSRKKHIRSYYICRPFNIVSKFPHDELTMPITPDKIKPIVELLNNKPILTLNEKRRDKFIEQVKEII